MLVAKGGLEVTHSKRQVYLKLAQEGVKREIAQTEHIGTLMRTDSALTQFMSTYMGTYAKGYVEAMTETAVRVALHRGLAAIGRRFGQTT